MDKYRAPKFILEAVDEEQHKDMDGNPNDFAIIRFHADAPYEDIAFKIINGYDT